MKKRLRKKLHIKDFAEYGIEFDMIVTSAITEKAFDSLMEQFVVDFVEKNGLFCGGGWNLKKNTSNFVVEIGCNIEKVWYYLPKLKKWFKERNITFEFNSSNCDLWYPERKIV